MTACGTCGTELRPESKFCNDCGAPVSTTTRPAEYKQVLSCSPMSCVRWTSHRSLIPDACATHGRALRPLCGRRPALRRHGEPVHRRRAHGGLRRAMALEDHAFRACLAALAYRRHESAFHRGQSARRHRSTASYWAELRRGHRRRNRLGHCRLHHNRRTGRHGATDGVGRAAGRSDA